MIRRLPTFQARSCLGTLTLLFGVILLAAPQRASSASKWLKLTSTNFELYTTLGEKQGRNLILYFERIQNFFQMRTQRKQSWERRVRIVAFRSAREHRQYQALEFAAAYYLGGSDEDYIVMHNLDSGTYEVAVHEYVHLWVRRINLSVPAWLNEGLADLWSTLQPMAGKVVIGRPPRGRFQRLRSARWLDLEAILSTNPKSVHEKNRKRVGTFYAQSWALTHMLNIAESYRVKFAGFVATVASGTDSADAFQKVYGKSLAEVTTDLHRYTQSVLMGVVLDTKFEKSTQEVTSREASPVESGLVLARLLLGTRKQEEAIAAYTQLAEENPTSPEVRVAMGYLDLRYGRERMAQQHFARAVELGSRDAKVHLDYAMLHHREDPNSEDVVPLLLKATQLDPGIPDAHYYLGMTLFNRQSYVQALLQFKKLRNIERERAVEVFRAMAYAYFKLGQREDAKKAAERARSYAQTLYEISSVEEIQKYLHLEISSDSGAPSMPPSDRGGPPRLVHRSAQSGQSSPEAPVAMEVIPPRNPGKRVEGTLELISCRGAIAVMRIRSGEEYVELAIVEPDYVTIKGRDSDRVDFVCGAQTPAPTVAVEYRPEKNEELLTDGNVISIEFK